MQRVAQGALLFQCQHLCVLQHKLRVLRRFSALTRGRRRNLSNGICACREIDLFIYLFIFVSCRLVSARDARSLSGTSYQTHRVYTLHCKI